jgi:hypothetical protein
MVVKELIKKLKLTEEASLISNPTKKTIKVMVACDEEWNIIYKNVEIELDEDNNIIIYGLSGSEKND